MTNFSTILCGVFRKRLMQYEAIKKRRLVIQAKFFPNNEDRVVSDDRALMHEGGSPMPPFGSCCLKSVNHSIEIMIGIDLLLFRITNWLSAA
jgi:hypothetical protein